MKKIVNITLAAFAVLSLSIACNKEADIPDEQINPGEDQGQVTPSTGETITITASLSDALTKVSFEPSYTDGKPTGLALTWAEGDQIRVYNHADRTQYEDFTLAASAVGQKVGQFTGTAIEASSYDVEVINGDFDYASQTQPADGVTTDLKYLASASDIDDITEIEFTDFSSVLALTAKMPSTSAAAAIKSVDISASEDIFNGGNSLTITLATPGSDDDILNLFATMPVGNTSIPEGTTLLVRFNAPGTDHTVYTRYVELGSGLTFTANKLNTININATQSDKHAGLTSCDGSTAAKAYLIADPYQLAAVNGLATGGATTYFKMIDDVDMTGVTHNYINTNSGYTQVVNFDGNNKTISKLTTSLFYVFKGSINDLTLDGSKVGTKRGIFAEYCQGTGHSITNVDIINGTMTGTSDNSGALIGNVNSGTDGEMTAIIKDCEVTNTKVNGGSQTGGLIGNTEAGVSITDCIVSGTSVSGASVVGGVIGYINKEATISGCKYTEGTVTATARWAGGAIGSIGEFATVVSDCHVESATITSSSDRVGGFIGQISADAIVKGCTVGTSSQRVTVSSTLDAATANVGGFVGVCYGKVLKDDDTRNKAFVKINSSNTGASTAVNIGGFVGYLEKGTIECSDVDADFSSIKGQQVGGFAAILTNKAPGCTIDQCTAVSNVNGNNYTGGFIGNTGAANHTITNNSSTGSVSGAATVGGFVGMASQGKWENNTTSCTVTGSGANVGGFAGQINGNVTVSKCSATGTSVSASGNVCGGFAAIAANGASISNCYSTTNLLGATRKRGGLIGHVTAGTVTIENSYATGNISANFELGGLIGTVAVTTFTLKKSVAWNGSVTASSCADNNWSSASIVGVSELTCTLTDNYRKPDMALTAYWGTLGYGVELTPSFQQPNVSSSSPLTDWNGDVVTSSTMRPYNGKCEAGKTLSQLASTTLGWSGSIWDFSDDLPTLK